MYRRPVGITMQALSPGRNPLVRSAPPIRHENSGEFGVGKVVPSVDVICNKHSGVS